MLSIFDDLYKTIGGPSETRNEDNFHRMYERQIENTREYLLRYLATYNVNDIESAWKNFTEVGIAGREMKGIDAQTHGQGGEGDFGVGVGQCLSQVDECEESHSSCSWNLYARKAT